MKQLHHVSFSVNKPEAFRKFLQQKNPDGEPTYQAEINACGGQLKKITETYDGVYQMSIIVDPEHERHDELFQISSSRGFKWELLKCPVVEPYEMKELAAEALEYEV